MYGACPAALAAGPQAEDYYQFSFPPRDIAAQIVFNVIYKDLKGQTRTREDRVLARGNFYLPKAAPLTIYFKPPAQNCMDSVEKLKVCHVKQIDMHNMDFDDNHVMHLKDFKELTYLNLYGTLVSDKILPLVGKFSQLNLLKLSRSEVTGTTFAELCHLKKLKSLFCANTALKKGTVAALKPLCPQLYRLDIARTTLSKEDVAVVQYLTNAEVLDISHNTAIDDSCTKYLTGLKKLKTLYIEDTQITDKSLPTLLKLPALDRIFVRTAEFWRSTGKPINTGRVRVLDISDHSDAPLETFSPLH